MVTRAPIVPLFQHCFHGLSYKRKIIIYQIVVLFLTYLTYTSYHAAKRPFSVVKGVLSPDCNVTKVNNTCHPWKPFGNRKSSKDLFGLLDCAFLMTYALTMFVSGYVAEHTNMRIYLSLGMILTGLLTSLLGMAYYFDIHTLSFFFIVLVLTGITQATGWPCVVEAVGMWFPEGRRGLIMGIWNTHTSLGNIVGSLIAGAFASYNWGLSFIIPGCIIGGLGIMVFIFLIPSPAHVGLVLENKKDERLHSVGQESTCSVGTSVTIPQEPSAISIWGALRIPGVIEYSFCLFFAKLVSYTFLFWLPYYIEETRIGGKMLDVKEAADLATLFDVGGAAGGIIAGVLVDKTKCPAMVNVFMLIFAAPFLFLLKFYGNQSHELFVTYLMVGGFFVNGPYALITTAVSASLGSHKSLLGNSKAMAVVTAIIDATGSLGAAIGPLLAGIISTKSKWDNVFYMLIGCDLVAAILLSRQFIKEIKKEWLKLINCIAGRSHSINSSESSPLLDRKI